MGSKSPDGFFAGSHEVGKMKRILLWLENKTNRTLLAGWLAQHYEVAFLTDHAASLSLPFDLCLLDGPTLDRCWQDVLQRKAVDEPIFLPFMLITSQREADLVTRHLWKTVDELIRVPIDKMELQARVEMLLRTRQLSLDLRLRNEELESFFHAMTHDLRAPLRAIKGFSDLLRRDEAAHLSEQGLHDLERIHSASEQMQELIAGLMSFAQVGYRERELQPLDLSSVVAGCLGQLELDIMQRQASIHVADDLPLVEGHRLLLSMAVTNLLSNALKFTASGVTPVISVRASENSSTCRLEIEDNGIGISESDQARLFMPFVQLHGVEAYGGVGLGLATVRKIVELLGGHLGVTSQPGQGSVFWMELRPVDKEHYAISRD